MGTPRASLDAAPDLRAGRGVRATSLRWGRRARCGTSQFVPRPRDAAWPEPSVAPPRSLRWGVARANAHTAGF